MDSIVLLEFLGNAALPLPRANHRVSPQLYRSVDY